MYFSCRHRHVSFFLGLAESPLAARVSTVSTSRFGSVRQGLQLHTFRVRIVSERTSWALATLARSSTPRVVCCVWLCGCLERLDSSLDSHNRRVVSRESLMGAFVSPRKLSRRCKWRATTPRTWLKFPVKNRQRSNLYRNLVSEILNLSEHI